MYGSRPDPKPRKGYETPIATMIALLALHIVSAVIWVGGMAFAYLVLRPSVGSLEPGIRLALWRRVFIRFFRWVWASIIGLFASGYGMILVYLGGFRRVGLHVHAMQAIGIVMFLLFIYLFVSPWRQFQAAIDKGEASEASGLLQRIRLVVATNLTLGFVTVIVGATGAVLVKELPNESICLPTVEAIT